MTRIALVVGPFITLIYLFAPAPYGFKTELNMEASAQSVATQPNTSPPIALKSFLEQYCVACHDKDDGVDSRFYVHDDAQSWDQIKAERRDTADVDTLVSRLQDDAL